MGAKKVFHKKYRFFTVTEEGNHTTHGKPYYWVIGNGSGDELGTISFFPKWKGYVLAPSEDSVWSAGCLTDAASAIKEIEKEHV